MASFGQPFALRADAVRGKGKHIAEKKEQFRADLNVRLTCPDCGEENGQLVEEYSSGDLVCGNCGLVLGDRIVDTRSEWRTFADSDGDDPSRVGGPSDPLLDTGDQFSTVISFKDNHTGAAKALQLAANRMGGAADRNLTTAFQKIVSMCDAISLPKSIQDTAKILYKRVYETGILRGRKQDAIVAACIFIACRQGRVPRTFKEIVALTSVSKKDIAGCFKDIERSFDTMTAAPPSSGSADALVTRFCNFLGLPPVVERAAVFVVERITEQGTLEGRNPITVASAAIYFLTTLWGQRKPASEIANIAGIQEGTIKFAYRLLLPIKDKLVEEKWFASDRPQGQRADFENLS